MTTSCTECRSPVEHALHAIAGKWKPMILWQLLEGTRRFAELQRAIPQVSAKVLTDQLRELEADELLERQVYAEVPPRVEYSLTELGRQLESVLAALCDWGRDYEARSPRTRAPGMLDSIPGASDVSRRAPADGRRLVARPILGRAPSR